MRQFTRVYDVDEGYIPTQAVLEVMEELDNIDRDLIASGVISCECPRRGWHEHLIDCPKFEDFSNSTSATGEVE